MKLQIDISKLKRDYNKNPLNNNHNIYGCEKPYKEDIQYLYNECNLRRSELSLFFNVSEPLIKKWLKEFNIKKPIMKRMCNHYNSLYKLYGVRHNSKLSKTIIKRKETSLKHFGTESPTQSQIIKDKVKNTCLIKYGDENPTLFGSKTFLTNMIKKWGVSSYSKTINFKNLYKNRIWVNDVLNKQFNTKIINNSFNKSKDEEIIYNILKTKFTDIKRQYKDEKYPYHCDFYIPKIDTYIEYNGHWTHGREPFIGSPKQLEKVKLWESKNNKAYKQAIYVWTKLDITKQSIAYRNNLNYVCFYNIIDFKTWFEGIKC